MINLVNPFRFSAPSIFASEEWIVFFDNTSSRLRYWKIDASVPSFSAIADIARPTVFDSIASDGSFIFMGYHSGVSCLQYAWNGSALTSRHSGDPGVAVSNGLSGELYCAPGNPGFVLSSGAGAFAAGIQAWSFQSAPAYSWGTPTNYAPVNNPWKNFLDFRVGAVGTNLYGNTFVSISENTGQRFDSMTVSGSTVTGHSNLTIGSAGAKRPGFDRDTGLIALLGSSATTIYLAQLNMTSRALSAIGNGTITGTNAIAVCCLKGFVITYENTGKVRSYSRSGSTLTLVNTLDLGGTPSQGFLRVSPYTNLIYLISATSGQSRVITISDAGVLSSLITLTGVTAQSSSTFPLVWLPSALPTI